MNPKSSFHEKLVEIEMKVVIFAGGLGTRMGSDTSMVPKPMLQIGKEPLLWHVMQRYSKFGFKEFIICLGYQGQTIRDYFLNYQRNHGDIVVDIGNGVVELLTQCDEDWKVTLVDTGETTSTAGRLRRVKQYIEGSTFFLTYGDGLTDLDLMKELEFHNSHGATATVLAVPSPSRFGELEINPNNPSEVVVFAEKPSAGQHLINGGYFILNTSVFELSLTDTESWEEGPLRKLAEIGQLKSFKHVGFWQPCDTPSERKSLETLLLSGSAPWLK